MAARLDGRNGFKQEKIWRDAVLRAVKRKINGGTSTYLECIAAKVVDMAVDGDMAVVREIGERLDGRAPQTMEIPDGAGGRLVVGWLSDNPEPETLSRISPLLSSPTLLDSNSSHSTIDASDSASALPTDAPEKP